MGASGYDLSLTDNGVLARELTEARKKKASEGPAPKFESHWLPVGLKSPYSDPPPGLGDGARAFLRQVELHLCGEGF